MSGQRSCLRLIHLAGDAIAEVRHTLRVLGRSLTSALIAVGMLAAAISVLAQAQLAVDDVWFRPHRLTSLSELYVLRGGYTRFPLQFGLISQAEYTEWREATSYQMVAVWPVRPIGRLAESEFAEVLAAEIEPEALRLLGIRPAFGSIPTGDPGAATVGGLISHRLWQTLGADPTRLGTLLSLAGTVGAHPNHWCAATGFPVSRREQPAGCSFAKDASFVRQFRQVTPRTQRAVVRAPRSEVPALERRLSAVAAKRSAEAPPAKSAYGACTTAWFRRPRLRSPSQDSDSSFLYWLPQPCSCQDLWLPASVGSCMPVGSAPRRSSNCGVRLAPHSAGVSPALVWRPLSSSASPASSRRGWLRQSETTCSSMCLLD